MAMFTILGGKSLSLVRFASRVGSQRNYIKSPSFNRSLIPLIDSDLKLAQEYYHQNQVEDDKITIPQNSGVGVNQSALMEILVDDATPQDHLLMHWKDPLDPNCVKGRTICYRPTTRGHQWGVCLDASVGLFTLLGCPTKDIGDAAKSYPKDKAANCKVVVLEAGDVFKVLSSFRNTHLGGDAFDKLQLKERIVDWLASNINKDGDIYILEDEQFLQCLAETTEKVKMELSSLVLTNTMWLRTPIKSVSRDAMFFCNGFDEVIPVDGSSYVPIVQEVMKKMIGKDPNVSVIPEVAARETALPAGLLVGNSSDIVPLDMTPLSLGLEASDGTMTKIIPRNTKLPFSRSELFLASEDDLTSIEINVLQGEEKFARDNKFIGSFCFNWSSSRMSGVVIKFDINANGTLTVTAEDWETRNMKSITITDACALPNKLVNDRVGIHTSNMEPTVGIRPSSFSIVSYGLDKVVSEEQAAVLFQQWKEKYGRIYRPEEEKRRFKNFQESLASVIEHNSKRDSWASCLNNFADDDANSWTSGFKDFTDGDVSSWTSDLNDFVDEDTSSTLENPYSALVYY